MEQVTEEQERAPGATRGTSPPAAAAPAALPPTRAAAAQAGAAQGLTVYDVMLIGMVTIWAGNPAALKWALRYVDPLVFNSLRFLLATLLPVTVALAGKESLRWQRGDGPRLLALGVLGHGIYQTAFIIAVNMTLAGNVALILSVSPAFVAIFGALLGYERVRAHTWLGVGLSLTGVGLVVLGSGERIEFGPRLVGDLLILGVTALWGLYTVLSQSLLERYSAVKLNALVMPGGAVALLLVSSPAIVRTAPTFPSVPPLAWLVLVASGLLAVGASYIVWYKGLQKLGATRTAIYTNLVPVLAAAISFFVLGEQLGWQFWAGMLLVLSGVTLARFGGRVLKRAGRGPAYTGTGENRDGKQVRN